MKTKMTRGALRRMLAWGMAAALTAAAGALAEENSKKTVPAAGDIVVFGRYEQDGNAENGPEPAEWLVLETGDGEALLLARYGLTCRPFHHENTAVRWDRCDLRKWMNTEMLETLFTEAEREAVTETPLKAEKHPRFSTDPGGDTTDRLFLMSLQEIERFFPERKGRTAEATPQARAEGAYVNPKNGKSGWWTRTTGHSADDECRVNTEGKFVNYDVNYAKDTVRPAVRVRLEALGAPLRSAP